MIQETDCNTGDQNTGECNTGDGNTGICNVGDNNTGDNNTGSYNTGEWNTGYHNMGDHNTGDWNTGSWNTGCFNTTTPDTITVFNKPCSFSQWDAAYKPDFLYFSLTEWVSKSEMTDEEKKARPESYKTGGYLKTLGYKEAFQKSWEHADKKDRERVLDLPNFDAEIFFQISGIDLRKGA